MQIVEKYYGKEIFYEDAFNEVATEAYDEAIDTNKIDVVSRPTVDIVQMEKGKDVIFTAVVQTKPEVELGKYKGIELEKIEYKVDDHDIEHELGHMQEHNSRLITIDDRAVEKGDIATIDFEGFVDGKAFEGGKAENYSLEIGSNSFIPGFEEGLIGLSKGDEKELKLTFPKDYHAEDLKGKKRSKDVNYPSQIAIYLCRELTTESFPKIGTYFGGRDHSTIISACNKVEQDIKEKEQIREVINELKKILST